jgi:hypothetical protein
MSFADKRTTRREFAGEIGLGAAGLAVTGTLGSWAAAAETKHGRLIKKIVYNMKEMFKVVGPGNADALSWLRGKDVENFNVNFAWGFYSGVGDWGARPHTHAGDQFLVFVGLDNQKPDYLGAEIEIALEDEKHIVNRPSCVIIPAGMQHGPVVTRSVEKPYAMYMVRLDKGNPSEINPA